MKNIQKTNKMLLLFGGGGGNLKPGGGGGGGGNFPLKALKKALCMYVGIKFVSKNGTVNDVINIIYYWGLANC